MNIENTRTRGNTDARTKSRSAVFTITDNDADKPIVYARLAVNDVFNDQSAAEDLIAEWIKLERNGHYRRIIEDIDIAETAYTMRKTGRAWALEQYCFELTELYEN